MFDCRISILISFQLFVNLIEVIMIKHSQQVDHVIIPNYQITVIDMYIIDQTARILMIKMSKRHNESLIR